MPDTEPPKPALCVEAAAGTVTCTFNPNSQPSITICFATNGGNQQEFSMSQKGAINSFLVLGRIIRALREDGRLPRKYIPLLDSGAVAWRRYLAPPAADQTGGQADA